MLIGCIYRPPPGPNRQKKQAIDSEIIKSFYYAKKANDKNILNGLIVAGDFIFPYIEWNREGIASVSGPTNSPGGNFSIF